jgi:putative heme degradation protein
MQRDEAAMEGKWLKYVDDHSIETMLQRIKMARNANHHAMNGFIQP